MKIAECKLESEGGVDGAQSPPTVPQPRRLRSNLRFPIFNFQFSIGSSPPAAWAKLCVGLALGVVLLTAPAFAATAIVRLKDGKTVITGEVVKHTPDDVTIKTQAGEQVVKWDEMKPASAYSLKKQLLDRKDAEGALRLGAFCLEHGMRKEADELFRQAVKLDPSLAAKVSEAKKAAGIQEEEKPGEPEEKAKPDAKAAKSGKKGDAAEPATPPKDIKALLVAQRARAKDANDKVGTKLVTEETAHFIIHTDFRDRRALGQICERYYGELSRIFGLGRNEPLWDGKCVIFFFSDEEDFQKFAEKVDNFAGAQQASGYTMLQKDGREIHIAIPQPKAEDATTGIQAFFSTLIHEIAHAFLHCIREPFSPRPWINEGIAQYFSFLNDPQYPRWATHKRLLKQRLASGSLRPLNSLLAMDTMPAADTEGYAMSWSLVEFLIKTDARKFTTFIQQIKGRTQQEDALKNAFRTTPENLEAVWRQYVQNNY